MGMRLWAAPQGRGPRPKELGVSAPYNFDVNAFSLYTYCQQLNFGSNPSLFVFCGSFEMLGFVNCVCLEPNIINMEAQIRMGEDV